MVAVESRSLPGQASPHFQIPVPKSFQRRGGATPLITSDLRGGGSDDSLLLLRVRLPDGTLQRIQLAQPDVTIQQLLNQLVQSNPLLLDCTLQLNGATLSDPKARLIDVGVKHGSLLLLTKPTTVTNKQLHPKRRADDKSRFDPFPDLARDYQAARRRAARKHGAKSYSDLADLQAALHVVDSQPEGPIVRLYMCETAAGRFRQSTSTTGLLLGTVCRERKTVKRKPRTSLSSTTKETEYCQVARVHAVWEPSQQQQQQQSTQSSLWLSPNVLELAERLGLQPIGWIFSYEGDRHEDDSLPVFSQDIVQAAQMQIQNMQRDRNCNVFVTLSMDDASGATEAFQMSNVAVQMVAEDMFAESPSGRFVKTRHSVVVDGKETTHLDSVLCLVNTALLSHKGCYSGNSMASSVKAKNGTLTKKARKAIVKNLDDDETVLDLLSDFSTLLALSDLLTGKEASELCETVRKFARGQKQSAKLSEKLRRKLRDTLDTPK